MLDQAGLLPLQKTVIASLRALKGADVNYEPMYPNFPEQVIETDYQALYQNALAHYWTNGNWKPDFKKYPQKLAFENIEHIVIDIATDKNFNQIFTKLLASSESLSAEDKKIIDWFIKNVDEQKLIYPEKIPFLENRAVVSANLLQQNKNVEPLVSTSTDILRLVTYLSGGDVSLSENTKFKSLPRRKRRQLVYQLERVIREEDIGRHKNKWIRLFHSLHVGDYSQKVFDIAAKARSNKKLYSFNRKVQALIDSVNIVEAVKLLSTRPGEFCRRLDHLLRLSETQAFQAVIIDAFLEVADKIPTRTLLQLLGHFKARLFDQPSKVVFPKGSMQKAVILRGPYARLNEEVGNHINAALTHTLKKRFALQEPLGKVWIDPALQDCPLPTQQRSASSGLYQVARGTRLPIGENNTLRFFIYWIGQDIDLSASFHDDKFKLIEQISYTNLKSSHYQAYHSGDITSAPNGASEFIDIDIDSAVKHQARYVVMNVYVFSGPDFAEHKTCFAGWMTRKKPKSNEIYDPKTVMQKIDITAKSRNIIPVVFDLLERKTVCVDLVMPRNSITRPQANNIESNRASIAEILEAIVNIDNKLSLHDLFTLHANGRGEIVESVEEAEIVYSMTQGITPYHINDINTDYIG